MKIVALIARILLGLTFVVFGANGLHPFLPMPPPPGGLAGQYVGALYASHYAVVPFLVQLIGGISLLVGRYVPRAGDFRSSDRQYLVLPCVSLPSRFAGSGCCGNSVVRPLLLLSAVVCGNFRGATSTLISAIRKTL